MSWHDILVERFEFNAQAARTLHAAWKKQAPKEAGRVSAGSLATRLGTLHTKGDHTGWWKQRPQLRQLLADLLEIEQAAIFTGGLPSAGALGFPEFPALPPLGANEAPCRTGRDGWLLDIALRALDGRGEGRVWITAPPGAGKSLVIRYLNARHADELVAVSVHSVAEAATHASSSLPLVVELEGPRSPHDHQYLRALTGRQAPTVILAPWSLPAPAGHDAYSSFRYGEVEWITIDGTPGNNWRSRMLDWIDARLEASERDTKLIKADVRNWLARCDPHGRIVATPGDLLALCADFDLHGSDGLHLPDRARRWLDALGIGMMPPETPRSWRRHAAAQTYAALVTNHLMRSVDEYGSLDSDTWGSLMPPDVRLASASETPGSAVAIGYMLEGGLLRGTAQGVMPYPTWVMHGIAIQALFEAFKGKDPSAWGALAADRSRCALVDVALDALPERALRTLAYSVHNHDVPVTLASLAACEAILAAIARRLAQATFRVRERDVPMIHGLVLRQLEALIVFGRTHHPFTRRDVDEWFATAWTLSLQVEAPQGFDAGGLAWELPGWASQLSLADARHPPFPSSSGTPWGADADVQRVAVLTPAVIERLAVSDIPDNVPRLLLPALFLASTRGWKLTPRHFAQLSNSWEEHFLAEEMGRLGADHRALLASQMWELAAQSVHPSGTVPVAMRIEWLRNNHPVLIDVVLANLEDEVIGQTARLYGIHRRATGANSYTSANPRELLALSRSGRQSALRAWLDGAVARGVKFDEARELVLLLDPEDLELALDLIRANDREIAAEFTAFVWRISPECARAETAHALTNGLPSAQAWCEQAPRTQLSFIVEQIASLKGTPPWVRGWAYRRVLDGGDAAHELFALAHGIA